MLTIVLLDAGAAKVAVGRFGVKGTKAFDMDDQE
jgi:hypothetical protein